MSLTPEPPRDCPLCPRLVEYRRENARQNPDWWNGPAASFGDPKARLLIAGLAPESEARFRLRRDTSIQELPIRIGKRPTLQAGE